MVFYSYQSGQFEQEFSPFTNVFLDTVYMLHAVYTFTSVTVPTTYSCQALYQLWGDSLIWALSHTPSLQCLYLTSLLYNPAVFPFLVNGWWMCSEVLLSQWHCHLARSQLEKIFLEGPFLEKQPGTRALSRCSIWFVPTEDLDIHCPCGVSPHTWRVVHQRWVTLRDL